MPLNPIGVIHVGFIYVQPFLGSVGHTDVESDVTGGIVFQHFLGGLV